MRAKVGFILLGFLLVYGLALFGVQRFFFVPQLKTLDEENAVRSMTLGLGALNRELELLNRLVRDYAAWDDSYRFFSDRYPEYISANLSEHTFRDNAVNIICFIDKEHHIFWSRSLDLETGVPLVANWMKEPFAKDHPFVDLQDSNASLEGVITENDKVYLVAARPVLRSDNSGPIAGYLVMARLFDQNGISRLSKQIRVPLRVWSLDGEFEDKDVALGLSKDKPHLIRRSGDSAMHIFFPYNDVFGVPALLFRADVERDATLRIDGILWKSLFCILLVGLIFLLVIFVVLRGVVVLPLLTLSEHVSKGETSVDTSQDLYQRRDELGDLARNFVGMLHEISRDRKMLADQSYDSGKAEMAGSLLHNIRNGLHPIAAFLDLMLADLKDIPLDELEVALKELEQSGNDAERELQLKEFRDLTLVEIIQLLRDYEDSLTKMLGQTKDVIKITNTYKQKIVTQPLEDIYLIDVLADAEKCFSPEVASDLKVVLHPSVKAAPPIEIHRMKLRQVLTNLMVFLPSEAHASHEVEVRVKANFSESNSNLAMEIIHARVNLAAAELERLFERGYTGCRTIPDQGLHWCANTINALGGRLCASREYGGMTFHLVLPLKGNRLGASVEEFPK